MKKYLILILSLFAALNCEAQTTTTNTGTINTSTAHIAVTPPRPTMKHQQWRYDIDSTVAGTIEANYVPALFAAANASVPAGKTADTIIVHCYADGSWRVFIKPVPIGHLGPPPANFGTTLPTGTAPSSTNSTTSTNSQ